MVNKKNIHKKTQEDKKKVSSCLYICLICIHIRTSRFINKQLLISFCPQMLNLFYDFTRLVDYKAKKRDLMHKFSFSPFIKYTYLLTL